MIVAIVLFCIIGIFIFKNEKKQKIEKAINSIPYTEVNKLENNVFSKVKGKTSTYNTLLTTPLNNQKCIYYHLKIQEEKKSGKNYYWSTIYEDEKITDFLLKSNEKTIVIQPTLNPKNFESHISKNKIVTKSTTQNKSKEITAFLDANHIKTTGIIGIGKHIRATETIIKTNQEVTVAGIASNINEPVKGYSKITTLKSNQTQKLIIADFTLTGSKNLN